ncbi:hypothetical protein DFH07DRAFT_784422 [Mycena maculata]|uniref:Uncharacterized protein n=1 Tax=Mycena maculata TaxID=230809 RepID=A0AAD7MJN7_9AGAR|nr:hypothetical protein DFH07DRAFT_784422 [Mycena maculata]
MLTVIAQAEFLIRRLHAEIAARQKCSCWRQGFPTGNRYNNDTPSDVDSSDSSMANDLRHLEISRKFDRMAIGDDNPKFIGKSSSVNLLQAAIDLKADVHHNGNGDDHGTEDDEGPSVWTFRCLQFWSFKADFCADIRPSQWDTTASRTVAYSFPPPDLTAHLINLYFEHKNSCIPLLHRPTFEHHVEKGLHHEDDGFALVLLLVRRGLVNYLNLKIWDCIRTTDYELLTRRFLYGC